MNTSTTMGYYSFTPIQKKEILRRLFEANQISFDELLVLLDIPYYGYSYVPDPQYTYTTGHTSTTTSK